MTTVGGGDLAEQSPVIPKRKLILPDADSEPIDFQTVESGNSGLCESRLSDFDDVRTLH